MANIAANIDEIIGNTPLLELKNYMQAENLNATLLAKLEFLNPAGSSKDRIAKFMLDEAERTGALLPDGVIIEPTSGNTGIGLAMLAAARGYRVIFTMPETMSLERRKLLAAYGAQLVLTAGAQGMAGAIDKANELAATMPKAWLAGQFVNPANPMAHKQTTGAEIWRDTDGQVDVLIAGVGTGGTITGTGEFLKQQNPAFKVIAVEPADSNVLSGGQAGAHQLQGIGAGFVPKILNTNILDEIIPVTTQQAYDGARKVLKTQGLLTGISSGAAMWAATQVARREENAGKQIVVILPDGGERYLSTPLFE